MTKVSVSTLKADLKSLTHWALLTESEYKSLLASWTTMCMRKRKEVEQAGKVIVNIPNGLKLKLFISLLHILIFTWL